MKVSVLAIAEQEISDSLEYYNNQAPGLGYEFVAEVKMTIERIKNCPSAWTTISENARRCLLNKFPFALIYQLLPDEIVIVAAMHLNRKPEYWKDRIKP